MASTEQIVLLMAAHDGGAQEGSWMDMRAVPACVAGASALYLLLQALLRSGLVQHLRARRAAYSSISEGKGSAGAVNHPYEGRKWAASHVRERGGWVIFTYKCLKTGATGALSTLVAYSAFDLERRAAQRLTWPPIALTLSTLYAAVLSFITVLSPLQISRKVETHLTVVLFSIFALYTYRDIWPLMTFTLIPADLAEGKLLWAKVVLATFAGAVIPLFEPYPYIPVDPEDPMPAPNPEQTASILSFLLFAYLDPTILLAYRIPHLGHDQLPPQCDYEYTRHLIAQAYPRLDPFSGAQKTGNLFWALLVVFRHSILRKALILMLMSVLKFASPIATNRLLHYLERDGAGARVRPWVWIACMALGPMGHTLLFQLYMFYSSGTLVRAKAIITALVFDHALRIRLKAEVHGGPAPRVTSAPASELSTKRNSRAASPDSAPDGPADAGRAGARSRGSTVASRATLVAPPSSADRGRGADGAKAATAAVGAGAAKCPHLVGRINNLVTTDLENITSGRDFLLIVSAPLQAFLSMWFLYVILGWSSFVGLAVMLLLLPVPVWCAKVLQGVQEKKMNATDARVQNVTETMSVLRMIKLFGWERRVRADLADTREDELGWIWKRKMLGAANNVINYAIPLVHMVVTFGVFTVYLKKDLSASIVFSSMTGFHMLRTTVSRVVGMVPMLIQAEVSLERVSDFLHNTELLDAFTETSAESPVEDASASHADDIGFGRASFSWSSETNDGSVTPSRQAFRLRIEDEVAFKRGSFNLIIGPTGAGKTSMLMALLGEMHYIPSGPDSWVNLPRKGGIAYAAQESWVQNETIRENIIFGAPFDEERYKKVIYQCSLKRDLTLFEAGDATEVGEKGLTLSGGHKARITLARAVYSSAEILLLDSIFAALDVHTARWIVEKCFKGDLMKGRTVLLVTHNVAMAAPISDFVIALGTDGRIVSQGSVSDALAQDAKLVEDITFENEAIELADLADGDNDITPESKKGKLVAAEDIPKGHVRWDAIKLFIGSMGGKAVVVFWVAYFALLAFQELFDVSQVWWLGWWARQDEMHGNGEVPHDYYLAIYCLLLCSMIAFFLLSTASFKMASLPASRTIHNQLIGSLLGSTFRWMDMTPTSRVVARCTQDIQAVDGPIPQNLEELLGTTIGMLSKLAAVMIFTPVFIIPGILIAMVGGYTGQMYIKAQLSVKREMANAKAPVLGIVGGAITGLTSIRAYDAQDLFKQRMLARADRFVRAARTFYNLNRWVTVRIDALSAVFAATLALYLVYGDVETNPSHIGFSLSMAVGFSELILWWVRLMNEFEVSGNSLERIQAYLNIEQEPKPTEGGCPPAYWPASGDIRVEKLSARYSLSGPKVLKDVSFHIKSGERVGIVGRTGSGKSSLTLSLLRCIFTEGAVYYDGLPAHSLNLDALRSNITIIPQVPELLSGTLRQNLDMFGEHDDATLNDALRSAGLFSLQRSSSDDTRLALDSQIAGGGGNLSVGERQILALARAIVHQSKLLILDEATAAIDYDTDAVIQASLKSALKSDVTVITVARRLPSVMGADKIMVLDAGRLVEFDTPLALLHNEKGLLRALVDKSADRDALYAMAEGRLDSNELPYQAL